MHDHLNDRELLILILERLSFIHDHQHAIIKEIRVGRRDGTAFNGDLLPAVRSGQLA